MAEEISQQISTKRLKGFVRHACIIAKKYKDREDARADLDDQIERMRRFSLRKKEMDEKNARVCVRCGEVADKV